MNICKEATPTIRSEHLCHDGRMGFYRFHSESLGRETDFGVFLPVLALQGEKIPALYVLAGLTCTEETFVTKSGIIRFAAEKGLAVIAPDTSPRHANLPGESDSYDFGTGAGFYIDATRAPWSSCYKMGSYIAQELPQYVERHFPLLSGYKSLMGHSMGGHGPLFMV